MGNQKINKLSKMDVKENTKKNNTRYSRREVTQKEYRVQKRVVQSGEACEEAYKIAAEVRSRSRSKGNLGKRQRNNGKLNKAQRNYGKAEEIIDPTQMNVAIKRQKQKQMFK